jgi:SAM-dependent methyltransferase
MQAAFDAHQSDKGNVWHGYHRFYERHLAHLHALGQAFNLVEIGYADGASARAWLDIFEHAVVYALDRAIPDAPIDTPRLKMLQGDQADAHTLDMVVSQVGDAHLIVDDGSHVPAHQLQAFNAWFIDLLAPGGVYVIEDIETSYWVRGKLYGNTIRCGIGHADNIVDIFKDAIHRSVNREFAGSQSTAPATPIDARAYAQR